MTIRYLTPRPPVVQALEWTGDNLAEVEAFGAYWGFSVQDNGDGTISTNGACCIGTDLAAGAWLVSACAVAQTAEQVNAAYQDVSAPASPFQYTVTEQPA